MQEPGTDFGPRPIDAVLGLTSSKVCPAKPRQFGCEPASQQLCEEWKLRLTFHSVLIGPRLGWTITTAATANSTPSHSLRRPTLDGDAGGDDGDEAQVDVPKSGACARAAPLPASASPHLPTPSLDIPPGLSHEAQSYTRLLLGSNEHRTGHPHPLFLSSEKKAKRHFAIAGAWQIYDWMVRRMDAPTRLAAAARISAGGVRARET
ncbi:hypothetical protein LA080_008697 [Diaporthe eres]|nr:hypothetical protein LA080_008697 [Diaporthe eres]